MAEQLHAIGAQQHREKCDEAKLLFQADRPVKACIWTSTSPDYLNWKQSPGTKLVHFVRHGQGYHNLLSEVVRGCGVSFSETGEYHLAVAENNPYMLPAILDPPLTSIGRDDAKNLRVIAPSLSPELYVVSPLKRATQTILIGFRDQIRNNRRIPVIAHESCREQFGVHMCDKRSPISDYGEDFPLVDYSLYGDNENEDLQWQAKKRETTIELSHRIDSFLEWLLNRPGG